MGNGSLPVRRAFVLDAVIGAAVGALFSYFIPGDIGGPSWLSRLSDPLAAAAIICPLAAIASVALRSRAALGAAAYIVVALGIYNLIGGLMQSLSAARQHGALRAAIALAALVWAVRLIVVKRLLRVKSPKAATSEAPVPAESTEPADSTVKS